jgi:hypothetical protein
MTRAPVPSPWPCRSTPPAPSRNEEAGAFSGLAMGLIVLLSSLLLPPLYLLGLRLG